MTPNPNLHAHHAKYFAHLLTLRQGVNGDDPLAQTLYDAKVDLNPHQIEAALFAISNPLAKGVLLADEVGLGKTIEAGIVLCQYWAERKRALLVVCPATLRKQWALELSEKFHLPAMVLDAKVLREAQRSGRDPLNAGSEATVLIVSYAFANKIRDAIRQKHWDMVVIDEAHKLRNAYRESNKMGQGIRWATEGVRKILLTATPLQNSLDELYGLSTLIDPMLFGDIKSFRSQYSNGGGDIEGLRSRLALFCKRTLREDVKEYIQYTERRALTRPFTPTDAEHGLYEAVSGFLRREHSYAIPHAQRHLIELIARKLLASSSIAIADTLSGMLKRLIALREARVPALSDETNDYILSDILAQAELDGWIDEEDSAEILGDDEGSDEGASDSDDSPTQINYAQLDAEIAELQRLLDMAQHMNDHSKANALLQALGVAFEQMSTSVTAHKPARKALIFTESRRTQQYLFDYLNANGFAHQVMQFNGNNNSPQSTAIYEAWLRDNAQSDRISGSRDIDIRSALIEYFRDTASIMIATEAAAEGVNMQFCSLVVNYDLPWNPQRIEQRIGRCHRYGQKHDVVVINFLNKRNEIDQRVLQLLTEKFKLFNGVFGASDEVIGTMESGIDFEKRILQIYQKCRTHEEIELAFKQLQDEMKVSIDARMVKTRDTMLKEFDVDVHKRLQGRLAQTQLQLGRFEYLFWNLTRWVLADVGQFDDAHLCFNLMQTPIIQAKNGRYHLNRKNFIAPENEFVHRLSNPLGEYVLNQAKNSTTPSATITFDVSNFKDGRLNSIEKLKVKRGFMTLSKLTLTNDVDLEEHLLFTSVDEDGKQLDAESCAKLFWCEAINIEPTKLSSEIELRLKTDNIQYQNATLNKSMERNNHHFQNAAEQLAKWAQDSIKALDKGLEDTKNMITQYERLARLAKTIDEQAELQTKISQLENKLRRQRHDIFDKEDEIREKRNSLQKQLQNKLKQTSTCELLFNIEWKLV